MFYYPLLLLCSTWRMWLLCSGYWNWAEDRSREAPLAKRSWKSCSSSPKLPQLSSKQQKHWLLEIACIYHNDLRTPFGVLTLFLVEEGSKVSNLSLGKLLGVEKIQGQGFKKQTCTCRGDAFLRINTTKSPEPSTFPGERKAQNQPSELIRQRW